MKSGMTLQELAIEVERQQNAKADYLMPTRLMEFKPADDGGVRLHGINEIGEASLMSRAHSQLSTFTGIPKRYYDRMAEEKPDLLCTNLNEWLHSGESKRMIRTLDGNVRAVLSDSYRTLDNVDFLTAVIEAIHGRQINASVHSCSLTEDRIYVKIVSNDDPVQLLAPGQELGVGHEAFDEVQSGLTLSNSEVGAGRLALQPGIHTIRCTNLATFRDNVMAKTHLGSKLGGSDDSVERFLTDDTRRTRDSAIWKELRDVAAAALDGRILSDNIERLQAAKGIKIDGDVALTVERIGEKVGLHDNERKSILDELIRSGDLTAYGVHSAVTQVSQHDAYSYDRATELELAGADVLTLPPSAFHVVV